jgi:hypothetical protein
MSGDCEIQEEKLCGCCAGVSDETPQAIDNRPALSSIDYRVGTYSTFKASMLAALSDPALAPLALLRTRDSSDFSVGLLDAWAVALDILTFYQERFANEAFLRTAVDQRSVFELARLVGYVPSRGVAASTVLAFTLSDASGSPDNVVIPAGTRVQSIPGPGQKPQVFETSTNITAVISWNALPVQRTIPWQLFHSDLSTWIKGTTTNVNVGDALLFIRAQSGVPVVTGPGDVRYVTAVYVDAKSGNTQISWDIPLSSFFATAGSSDISIYVFRKKAALYGVQAPSPLTLSTNNTRVTDIPGYPSDGGTDWEFSYADGSNQINLDASYPGLEPTSGAFQWIVLTGLTYTSFFQITKAIESNPSSYTLTAKTTQVTLGFGKILTGNTSLSLNDVLGEFVEETRNITAYIQSVQLTPADVPITNWQGGITFPLAQGMIVPVQGSSVSVVGGQGITADQPIGISGKRVRLQVLQSAGAAFTPGGSSESLQVADNQIFLVDSYPPSADPGGSLLWSVLTTSNVAGTLLVAAGGVCLLPSYKDDPLASEATRVSTVEVQGDITFLGLQAPLVGIYDAATATVNANAVEATHGETVHEILGSGDASNAALQFSLKQSPLTYVTSASNNGSQSTLQVWVNNLRWQEVNNLLSPGPADRAFITSASAAGNIRVQFGNGVQGARTPTGVSNIRAVYRKGIGAAGMISAGQLSQALDRPQGLRSVTNPSAASGAADPASAEDARKSAPMPTLTIGRVVSLEDYQNFALAFPGIAKALATWTWFGNVRGVFLSVSGANGTRLQTDDPIVKNLVLSLKTNGNPFVPLQIASYEPVLFQFSAQVRIDQSTYDSNLVLGQIWQNLTDSFSFERRQLGQNVASSEIVEILQQTAGVIATQLQAFHQSGEPGTVPLPQFLCASSPNPPEGAQLLLLDPVTHGNIGIWS